MAAVYMRSNALSTPIVSLAIAWVLTNWVAPLWPIAWAALSTLAAIATAVVNHAFLNDPQREKYLTQWSGAIEAVAFLGSFTFALSGLCFYIPGERLNNILLMSVLVACIASVAAMAAPRLRLAVFSAGPHAAALVAMILLYERYPVNIGLSVIAIVYAAITFVFAFNVSRLAQKSRVEIALERAERANAAKTTFLSHMSHELRTPLNAILGFAEIIRDQIMGVRADNRYQEYAANIHTSGAHLLTLVNDILDLGRVEAGRTDLKETQFGVREFICDTLRFVMPQASRKRLELRVESGAELQLFADCRAVRQILVNLLSNAIKFTPDGGCISVRAELTPSHELCLSVFDNGAGIHYDDLRIVLESFGQGRHEIAKSEERGIGLGLPIAKGLAEAHGAAFHLESQLGVGTCVRVVFPATRARVLAQIASKAS